MHEHEHKFEFNDWGWEPQFESWSKFKSKIEDRFRTELAEYEKTIRSLANERGLVEKPPVCSDEHFEWLAHYKCSHKALSEILKIYTSVGDTSTISKGLHKAALLADTEVPARSKLKSH